MDNEVRPEDSNQDRGWAGTAGFAALAFVLGAIGLGPLFSDSPSAWSSVVIVGVFFFASGLFIGYYHPKRWWISGVTAWGGMLLAVSVLIGTIRFRDVPILNVVVTEGEISVSPEVISAGDIGIRQINRGTTTHLLGIPRLDRIGSLERIQGQPISLEDLRMTFKRLAPGEAVTLYYGGLEPGRYMLACLEATPTGIPHRDLGEVAEFTVE